MYGNYYEDEESSDSYGFLLKIPRILFDRRWLVIPPAVIGSVAGVAFSFFLHPTYESKATLLVESSDIAEDAIANPAEAISRRIAKIREQLLSRPDLIELIKKYNLYPGAGKNALLSTLIDNVRDNTTLEAIDADVGSKSNQNSLIAFSLSFRYSRPDITQIVTQSFVDRLLTLDTEALQAQADSNVKILADQESDLENQLSTINGQINTLSGQGGQALAAGTGINIVGGGGAGYESQIADLRRQNSQLSSQLGTTGVARDAGVVAAEAQLATARTIYADNHPDVKLAEAHLAAAKSAAANLQNKSLSGSVSQQIAANNAMIAQLSQALNSDASRAAAMAAAQAKGPEFAARVAQLNSQAELIRGQLGRIQTQSMKARTNADLTEQRKGERLTLIEAPARPDHPISPNKPLLILGGIFGGTALGIILALAIELILSPIRSAKTLAKITGSPPLAVVPIIRQRHAKGLLARVMLGQGKSFVKEPPIALAASGKKAPSKSFLANFLGRKSTKKPLAKER